MNTDALVLQDLGTEIHQGLPKTTICSRPSADAAESSHSKENILRWSSYLPPSCIRMMIAMGWDRST
jgi:hypothetical protein